MILCLCVDVALFFFFKHKTAYDIRIRDWGSDLCSSDRQALVQPLLAALRTRLAPEIHKAFGFRATRIERYLIGCYDESDRGFFRAHRDNTSKGTAHRAFAVSLNLNSEEYEGGQLTFPEYGSAMYKPRSEEHTSELQSLMRISYAVFCLKKNTPHS